MTVELIDGRAGKPHIGGDDLGNFKAGFAGTAGYVLKTENKFAATLETANSLTINTGAAIMPTTGRHVRIIAAETLTIESGTQGQNRNDLVVLRATTATDDTTVETAELVVIKGTPTTGTAADPSIVTGDLKLYRVALSGTTVATPVALFTLLPTLIELNDKVPTSRTVNGKALSANITLAASDVGAVPTSRTVNGKALSANITLAAGDLKHTNGTTLQSAVTTLQSSVAQPIRSGKYVKLSKTISAGGSYTVPVAGWYVLSCTAPTSGNAWWMIGSEPIFGGYSRGGGNTDYYGTFPLAKGTILNARSISGAAYCVNGYYPWY